MKHPCFEVLTDLLCNNTNNFRSSNSFLKKENIFLLFKLTRMLQRIQTIYLAIVFIIVAVLPYVFPLWKLDGKDYMFNKEMLYVILFGLSTALTVISIISFAKRQHQFVLNRLNMILNLILLGLFVYRSLNLSGGTTAVSEKGIGMFLPIFSIVFLVLANKAIKKDEDLVKSVDRLR
jgi:hypothetical protein